MKKRFILSITLLLIASMAYSQDMMVFKNGDSLKAKILRIDKNTVEYRAWGENDGPVRTLPLSHLASIAYENGHTDYYPMTLYVDGDDLHDKATGSQISDELLKVYLTPSELVAFNNASQQYSKARKNSVVGKWLLIPGAVVVGVGTLGAVTGKVRWPENEAAQKQAVIQGIVAAAAGAALSTVGIVLMSGKGKKMDAAHEEMEGVAQSFNSRNSDIGSRYSTTLKLGVTPNGFGIALLF